MSSHPPSKGQTLVQMHLKLKKEFENSTIRSKCWGMPKVDQDEIESQANEMLKAGLAEEYPGKDFPKFCSPTLLVDKEKGVENKTSKSRRMCVDYRKLKQKNTNSRWIFATFGECRGNTMSVSIQMQDGYAQWFLASGTV